MSGQGDGENLGFHVKKKMDDDDQKAVNNGRHEATALQIDERVQENGDRSDKLEEKGERNINPEINYRGIISMPFIIGNETFEKLGAIGTLANLLIYLTSVFNMKSITATTIINVFNGTANFGTLVGAFLCDTFFGRYNTLGFCTVASFVGLFVIALTAAVKQLHPPVCEASETTCTGATPWQMTVLLTGFVLMIIGAGGVRPCNLAFGADQFNPNTESGKRGINSFFNWYFLTFTFAEMISLTLIVYVQTNISWTIGLMIPAALMLLACVLFFGGTKLYVKVKPEGSPITSVAQVLVACLRKKNLKMPQGQQSTVVSLFNYHPHDSINSKLSHTDQFRCLDKAAFLTEEDKINPDGSSSNAWRLCTLQQVEEVKCLARVLPIWASAIIYHVAIVQQSTYAVFQALQSDRRFGNTNFKIPAASYVVFQMLTLTLFLTIYDRILVPLLRRITGIESGITILQRMGFGIFLSVLTMIVSAVVETKRRTIAVNEPNLGIVPRKGGISSMSGNWLVPQLILAGLAEAFMAVGQVEFYYKQFPENMRSIGGSLFYCGMAMSSYLSSLLIWIVHRMTGKNHGGRGDWLAEDLNKGRLDYFYYVVAGLGVFDLVYFLVCAKWYRYKGDVEEEKGEGSGKMS